jgi:hypothetical protein
MWEEVRAAAEEDAAVVLRALPQGGKIEGSERGLGAAQAAAEGTIKASGALQQAESPTMNEGPAAYKAAPCNDSFDLSSNSSRASLFTCFRIAQQINARQQPQGWP